MNKKELEAMRILRDAIIAVSDLMNESTGVYGLHLNGEGAPWDTLRTGGEFEEWLINFDEAIEIIVAGIDEESIKRRTIRENLSVLPRGFATTERDIRELAATGEPSAEWLLELLEVGDETLLGMLNSREP